ncbi:MAG: CHAT domain-containing protein [Acidobacteriota bacterium]
MAEHRTPLFPGVLALALVLVLSGDESLVASRELTSSRAHSAGITLLEPGRRLELDIPGVEGLTFDLNVGAGTYVEIGATRPYGDLRLVLERTDGTIAAQAEDGFDGAAALRLAIVTQGSRYRVRVTNRAIEEARKSRFELVLHTARSARQGDAERAALYARLGDARAAWQRSVDDDGRRAAMLLLSKLPPEFVALGAQDGAAFAWSVVLDESLALGDSKGAREAAAAALAGWRAVGARREEGRALSDVGLAAYNAFDKQAIDAYTEALAIHEETGDAAALPQTLRRIGWYWRWQGDRRQALTYYERALPLFIANRDWQGEVGTLGDTGLVHKELGDADTALTLYERALALAVPGRDGTSIANLLLRAGAIYNDFGEYDRASTLDRQAIAASVAVRDRRVEANAHHSLGNVLARIGDYDGASHSYRRALVLSREMQQRNGIAAALRGLSSATRGVGDLAEAERLAHEGLEAARASGNVMEETRVIAELAAIALEGGRREAAAKYASEALEHAAKSGLRSAQASALLTLATIQGGSGSLGRAEARCREALEIVSTLGSAPELESRALTLRARFRLARADRVGALADAEQALQIAESLRSKFVRQEHRASYFESRQRMYALKIEILLRDGDDANQSDIATAFETAERARARSLLDTLAESRVDLRGGVDPALLERERSLRRRVNYKSSELDRLLQGTLDPARLELLTKNLDSAIAEWKDAEAEIRAASPRYAVLTQPEPLTIDAVRKEVLDDDTLLLEFALGGDRSWLFAVTRSDLLAFELPPRSVLEPRARAFYAAVTARQSEATGPQTLPARDDRELQEKAAELSRMLLGPVSDRLANAWKTKRLAIVAPDGLGLVPFAALPLPVNDVAAPLLIADHEIVSLPSASAIAELRRHVAARTAPTKTIAVVADPVFDADDPRVHSSTRHDPGGVVTDESARSRFSRLVFSREEARAISDVVPGDQVVQFTGFDADAARVIGGELADFRILHFATHGLLHTDRPELSGLALSLFDRDGREKDGFLRSIELYDLKLSADLAVLSACQTALGREIRGEGLVGLTRSFMYAGVPRVVSTLWKIDDAATAELMRLFYRALLKDGRSPDAALREAQRQLAQNPAWTAPYYWAGFVLQGDWTRLPAAE